VRVRTDPARTMQVSERPITMQNIIDAANENRLIEMFGAGTAAVVAPISSITFAGQDIKIPVKLLNNKGEPSSGELAKRLFDAMIDIQTGQTPHDWSVVVD
jgi:branched-chain amino acid aminotransferase